MKSQESYQKFSEKSIYIYFIFCFLFIYLFIFIIFNQNNFFWLKKPPPLRNSPLLHFRFIHPNFLKSPTPLIHSKFSKSSDPPPQKTEAVPAMMYLFAGMVLVKPRLLMKIGLSGSSKKVDYFKNLIMPHRREWCKNPALITLYLYRTTCELN